MAEKREERSEACVCPYCDGEIAEASFPYCEACKVTTSYCPECEKPVSRDNKVCPHCGAEIKK